MSIDPETAALLSASEGFDHLFGNQLEEARKVFSADDSPFHQLGMGVCAFLEAALGMETHLMGEAAKCLGQAEAGAKKRHKASKPSRPSGNFASGLEWEILLADAVVLQGMMHALGESYMGYLQCLYSLNSAHSKFTKLYKTVFPAGLDAYVTPATTPLPSRNASTPSLLSVSTTSSSTGTISPSRGSFFSSWSRASRLEPPKPSAQPDGPMEELIVSGAAFGFGLFNLVFSLLPAKVKTVVGFLGFQHDRRLALQALAVSAARKDVHSVFAGLALMTYYGIVLLLSGYQADEAHILRQDRAIVEHVSSRYSGGALWILNRAKILRMTYDPEGAITVLQEGLKPGRSGNFQQADALLVFELAWTLLSQRRYQEAGEMFLRMTELNSWSHATYYTIAGGCYLSVGDTKKAKELLNAVPGLLDKRKMAGKDLPTEVFIKKKLAFYKDKARRNGGDEANYVDFMKISIAEELAIFWNTHQRITREIALAHIRHLSALTPSVAISSPHIPVTIETTSAEKNGSNTSALDLTTPDELAIRSVILGVVHRTLEEFGPARQFFLDAHKRHADVLEAKWVGGVALFELAVLDLKEAEAQESGISTQPLTPGANGGGPSGAGEKGKVAAAAAAVKWQHVLKGASDKLEKAMAISGNTVDLSSRLDTRVNMLKDEIALKREMLGLPS